MFVRTPIRDQARRQGPSACSDRFQFWSCSARCRQSLGCGVIGNRPSVLPVFLRFSGFRAMPVHAVVRSPQFPTRFTGRVVAIGRAEHLHWRWSKDFSIYLLGCHIVLPRFQNGTLNPKWELFKIAQVRAPANFRRSYRRRRPIVIPKPLPFHLAYYSCIRL